MTGQIVKTANRVDGIDRENGDTEQADSGKVHRQFSQQNGAKARSRPSYRDLDRRLSDRLSFKQAKMAVFVAFFLGLLVSGLQIVLDLREERDKIDKTVHQILDTLRDPATQAVYGLDTPLAEKVAKGLLGYKAIYSASVVDDFGTTLAILDRPLSEGRLKWLSEYVFGRNRTYSSPLLWGESQVRVGELVVGVDTHLIASSFLDRAGIILVGGMVRNIILACVLTLLFYTAITKPLMAVIMRLRGVDPERPGSDPIDLPKGHERDELGLLVHSANDLLVELERSLGLQHKLGQAVEQSPATVVITDRHGCIEYANPKFEETSGYKLLEVIGKPHSFLHADYTSERRVKEMWETVAAGLEWRGEFCNRKKDGTLYWEDAVISPIKDGDGNITHYLSVKEDVTLRHDYEAKLLKQANYDDMTGLPNRVLLLDRLKKALSISRQDGTMVAVLHVDLDRFKALSETFGHLAGDEVLRQAAKRLDDAIMESDTAARHSDDEFIIVLPSLKSNRAPEKVASRIVDLFHKPFLIEGQEVFSTATVGLSVFPADGDDAQEILRNAYSAMVKMKNDKGDGYRFFQPEMNVHARERLEIESLLRGALARGEFRLHFQPIVDLASNRVVKLEALIRWVSPERGMIAPDAFISIAEDTGMIVDIGAWVLEEAVRQGKELIDSFGEHIVISVNVSPQQLVGGRIVEAVERILRDHRFSAKNLELELTESALLDGTSEASTCLRALSDRGISLAIDDFGTGYSSLSYLRTFPFNTLKIDRAFISDVTEADDVDSLVDAILVMAKSLGLRVVAEGIETEQQLAFLKDRNCALGQGYHFSKPLPFNELCTYFEGCSEFAEGQP